MIDVEQYDDVETYEKFAPRKKGTAVDKRTKHDIINQKRREREAEKAEAVADQEKRSFRV